MSWSHTLTWLDRSLEWLERFVDTIHGVCERRRWLLFGVLSIAYFAATSVLASRRPLWNDELFTYHIAGSSTLSDIWAALMTGADQSPFPFYLLTRWSMALFGGNEWALRLPAIASVWIAGLCVFLVAVRYSGALFGLVAVSIFAVTGANYYSYEARPYGLVLAFSALAWVCWLHASSTSGRTRAGSLAGLGLSLAAAVCSHYYAVFVFIPIGIGEIARSTVSKRPDWFVWLAMLAALLPLSLFIPLIQGARTYFPGFWSRPSLLSIADGYASLLMPAPLALLAGLIVGVAYSLARPVATRVDSRSPATAVPRHEVAAAVGFVALPVIAVLATRLTTGTFTFRYALASVLGVSVLSSMALARLTRGHALTGIVVMIVACAQFGLLSARNRHNTAEATLDPVYHLLQRESAPDVPLVVADGHSFMMLTHYAPRDVSSRLVYLADPEAALRHLGHDTVDRGMLDLRPWLRLEIHEYRRYLTEHSVFFVYANVKQLGFLTWLLTELTAAPYRVELRQRIDDHLLFRVTRTR